MGRPQLYIFNKETRLDFGLGLDFYEGVSWLGQVRSCTKFNGSGCVLLSIVI